MKFAYAPVEKPDFSTTADEIDNTLDLVEGVLWAGSIRSRRRLHQGRLCVAFLATPKALGMIQALGVEILTD